MARPQPRFIYLCGKGDCARQCRFKRGKIRVGPKKFVEGLGKPNCPTHGPTKARRIEAKTEAKAA